MSDLEILTPDRRRWREAIARTSFHDAYHLPGYHALAAARGEGDPRLFLLEAEGEIVALPLLLRPVPDGGGLLDATSVYGYPGPVASAGAGAAIGERFRAELARELGRRGVVSVFSRLHPLFDQRPLVAGLGKVERLGRTVALDLELDADRRRSGYRQNHLRDVRRLERLGAEVVPDTELDHLETFGRLYRDTMERVGAAAAYRFGDDYFDALLEGEDGAAHLLVCRVDGGVACAGIFFHAGPVVQYHLSGTAEAFVGRAPLKLLLDAAADWGAARGARWLHLGGGVGAREDGLFHFKRGFGGDTPDFAVWRWIVDRQEYSRLCERRGLPAEGEVFFPAYRAASEGP